MLRSLDPADHAEPVVNLHASCVAIEAPGETAPARGVLILGPSGAGKSALALELMAFGAALVSDDRTEVCATLSGLVARAPAGLPAMIEARGIGLLPAQRLRCCRLTMAVDLSKTELDRMPPPREVVILGRSLPLLHGVAMRSFPAAILQYLRHGAGKETGASKETGE